MEFSCEDCKYGVDNTDKIKVHRKKKHEKIGPEIEEEIREQRSEKDPSHQKLARHQKNEEKEEAIRRKMGNRKSKKAKIRADLRREVKLQERIATERKYKEERGLRQKIDKYGEKEKNKEMIKGLKEKNKELENSMENIR